MPAQAQPGLDEALVTDFVQLPAQRVGIDVVDERALPADLDHRQPLPVARLQLRVAADVDRLVGDAYLVQGRPRALAEVAARRVVEPNVDGYG